MERPAASPRFDDAYSRAWTPIYRFALAWTNDPDEAMDVAQEVFARLWVRWDGLGDGRDIVPLGLTIARHLLTDRWRALRRRLRLRAPLAAGWTAADTEAWLDVQSAFARLTATERVAVVATGVIGLSYAEVGDLLGRSEGSVRAAASRGRQKLADATSRTEGSR
jgi:RNA polymerase sigma factor (sigma-70 family)